MRALQPSTSPTDVIRRLEAATLAIARAVAGERRDLFARFNPVTGLVQIFQRFRVVSVGPKDEREIGTTEASRLGWQGGDYLLVELLHGERDRDRLASHEARFGSLLGLGPGWRNFGEIAAGIVRQLLVEEARA